MFGASSWRRRSRQGHGGRLLNTSQGTFRNTTRIFLNINDRKYSRQLAIRARTGRDLQCSAVPPHEGKSEVAMINNLTCKSRQTVANWSDSTHCSAFRQKVYWLSGSPFILATVAFSWSMAPADGTRTKKNRSSFNYWYKYFRDAIAFHFWTTDARLDHCECKRPPLRGIFCTTTNVPCTA